MAVADPTLTDREAKAMDVLAQQPSSAEGREHVMRLRRRFRIEGPNGVHQVGRSSQTPGLRSKSYFNLAITALTVQVLCVLPHGPNIMNLILDAGAFGLPFDFDDIRLPYALAKSVIQQVLQDIQFMHRAGVAHVDIQPGNILCSLLDRSKADLADFRQQDIYDHLDDHMDDTTTTTNTVEHPSGPDHSTIDAAGDATPAGSATGSISLSNPNSGKDVAALAGVRNDMTETAGQDRSTADESKVGRHRAPTTITYPQILNDFTNLDPATMNFKVSDFGGSFLVDEPSIKTSVPLALRSPEFLVGRAISKEQDIWAFGCLAFELVVGFPPFPVFKSVLAPPKPLDPCWKGPGPDPQHTSLHDDQILYLTDILGTIPKPIRDQ